MSGITKGIGLLLLAITVTSGIAIQNVFADTTGVKSPTDAISVIASINDFVSRTSAFASDDVRATAQLSDNQAYGGFTLGVPSGATINSLTVSLEAQKFGTIFGAECGDTIGDPNFDVRLSDPTLIGDPTGTDSFTGTILTTTDFTQAVDTIESVIFSPSHTAEELDNLWILLTANCGSSFFGSDTLLRLDHVTVEVDYDEVDTTPPVITLLGDTPQFINITDAYIELGATALDDVDGNITGDIVIDSSDVNTTSHGAYTVTYNVQDSSGNDAVEVSRDVVVLDNIAPVIVLNGDGSIEIPYGIPYLDLGATAFDVDDGNLTSSIVTVNPVNVFQPLTTFFVTYDVTDTSGNVADQVVREIKVLKKPQNDDEGAWKSRPTFGISPTSNSLVVECGFKMDQSCFDLTDSWHTPFDKIVINTGETHNFELNVQAQKRLHNVGFCLVPQIGSMEGELCIGITLDGNGDIIGTEINQDESLVDESLVTFSATRDGANYNIKINNVMFQDQPFYEVIGLYASDYTPRIVNTFLNEGLDVVGDSLLESKTIMIPKEGKPVYSLMGDNSNMQELTLIDKFSNLWENEEGILYTFNEYKTWVKVTPDTMQRFQDQTENVMTRQNSNFGLLVDYENESAMDTLKKLYPSMFSEESFAEINNIKSMELPEVTQREITLSQLSWYHSN